MLCYNGLYTALYCNALFDAAWGMNESIALCAAFGRMGGGSIRSSVGYKVGIWSETLGFPFP